MSLIPLTRRPADDLDPLPPSPAAEVRLARRFRPDIEGMRAIAVLLVVLYHAHLLRITGGYVGVDVFFVISGFLITRQLFETQQRRGRVHLADFYIRRMKRLLPAAMVVTLSTLLAARIWTTTLMAKDIAKDAIYTALYGMNIHLAAEGTNYLTADKAPSPLQHFWSLAVEEQFYFALPLIILAAAILSKRLQRGVLFTLVAAAVGFSLYLSITMTPKSAPDAYFGISTRAWELGLGALVALASPLLARIPSVLAAIAAWAGLGLIFWSAFTFTDTTVFPGSAALLPVGGAALVIAAGCRKVAGSPEMILGRLLPQLIGKISYSLYLWHWPVLVFTPLAIGHQMNSFMAVQALFISLILAIISYFHVELPARRLKLHKPAWMLSGIGLSACTAAIAVVFTATLPSLTGSGVAADTITLSSGNLAAVQDAIQAGLKLTAVPSNLTPSLTTAAKDTQLGRDCFLDFTVVVNPNNCVFGDPKGTKTVVLFGDSHAAHWLGGLDAAAKQAHLKLLFRGKVACSVAQVTLQSKSLNRIYTECDQWRAATVAEIVAVKPVLIIASQSDENPGHGVTDAVWAQQTAVTLTALGAGGSRVVFLSDIPSPMTAPAECLAANLSTPAKCTTKSTDSGQYWPDRRGLEAAAADAAGATVVDTTPWVCATAGCPAIVGNVLVFRDNSGHLTNTYSTWLAPVLLPILTGDAGGAAALAAVQTALADAAGQKAVPSNLTPTLADAATDLPASYTTCHLDFLTTEQGPCVFGDPSGTKTVVLFGDSHANEWFGAFDVVAKKQHWRLINWTKAACPAADLTVFAPNLKREYTECNTWRTATVARIKALHPDLVVVGQAETLSSDATDQEWANATLSTMRSLSAPQTSVMLIGDNTYAPQDPAQCLAKHLKNAAACAYPLSKGYILPTRHTVVAKTLGTAGFTYIDPSKWLCTDTTCPVVVGKMAVYRDAGHITDTYATFLAPLVAPLLKTIDKTGSSK